MTEETKKCPHCGQELLKWMPPADSNFEQRIQLVCFNNECQYFIDGWAWMKEKHNQAVSYRFRLDPETGDNGPLPVWSPAALREGIVE